jgi:hypothetical protein
LSQIQHSAADADMGAKRPLMARSYRKKGARPMEQAAPARTILTRDDLVRFVENSATALLR